MAARLAIGIGIAVFIIVASWLGALPTSLHAYGRCIDSVHR